MPLTGVSELGSPWKNVVPSRSPVMVPCVVKLLKFAVDVSVPFTSSHRGAAPTLGIATSHSATSAPTASSTPIATTIDRDMDASSLWMLDTVPRAGSRVRTQLRVGGLEVTGAHP